MITARTYQRRIAKLKKVLSDMEWVQPIYNGTQSCPCCGNMRHWGHEPDCYYWTKEKDKMVQLLKARED